MKRILNLFVNQQSTLNGRNSDARIQNETNMFGRKSSLKTVKKPALVISETVASKSASNEINSAKKVTFSTNDEVNHVENWKIHYQEKQQEEKRTKICGDKCIIF